MLKYHGLGNDFLVALDPSGLPGGEELDAGFVRLVCDRRRGFGADGVVVARPPRLGGDVAMELRNADGGRAETSGNGLRCLALALLDGGVLTRRDMTIETDAGRRRCEVGVRVPHGCAEVLVEMGPVTVGAEQPAPSALGSAWRAFAASTGNPHLVLIGPCLDSVDIEEIGRELEPARAGGQNVEAVALRGRSIDLLVWERGAGRTQACGSGSVAAAAVARSVGLVDDRVEVRNPGGSVIVHLHERDHLLEAALEGPACRIGRVELELEGAQR